MKKNCSKFVFVLSVCLIFIFGLIFAGEPVFVNTKLHAQSKIDATSGQNYNNENKTYNIFDESGELIETKQGVGVGDYFILNNLKTYEITSVNSKDCSAVANCLGEYELPKITFSNNAKLVSGKQNKTIGLYMSHNDESYLDGDGVESVYGEGGIHDITNNLSQNLMALGINTTVNETLHLPHDSGAYTRSKLTAQDLLNQNAGYIFDIHRDGAPKNAFVVECEGKECCQIRIVVGQSNNNQEENLNLASNIFAVGNQLCPNLFKDIYFGKGSYNQNLTKNALLFEMGSHEVPKNLVLETTTKLAEVLNKSLFESETNQNGDLVVYKNSGVNNKSTLLNLKNNQQNLDKNNIVWEREIFKKN